MCHTLSLTDCICTNLTSYLYYDTVSYADTQFCLIVYTLNKRAIIQHMEK